jgi:hypothetical protein
MPRDLPRRHLAGAKLLHDQFPAVAVLERHWRSRREVLRKVQAAGSEFFVVKAYAVLAKKGLHGRGESTGWRRLRNRPNQEKIATNSIDTGPS